MREEIIVKGARTHNLKNITVSMPRNKMIAITGLSGSGKSSLAFDTIFAEGQRRYIESLSSYARQFLRQMQKPDVDDIVGLSPAISIDQSARSSNPRSTVATITEIYDYLRVLYARIGVPHCLECARPIEKLSTDEILQVIIDRKDIWTDKRIKIFAPVVRGRKGEYYQLLYDMLGRGYSRAVIDGEIHSLRDRIVMDKQKKHTIDILIDDIEAGLFVDAPAETRKRLLEAVEQSIALSDGVLRVNDLLLSNKFICPHDGFSFVEVEPRLFSFNSPYGACEACNGLGTKVLFGEEVCGVCNGARLRPEALAVRIGDKNVVELTALALSDAYQFFKTVKLTERQKSISEGVVREIEARLSFMLSVGLEYLTLDRRAGTLSGGEAQRIRLASQLGSGLVGALYVLDEPTIGLHSRDNDRLISTLTALRDAGNTIIVVEHDEDTIFASDYIVDIGPGAGIHGGEVVVSGELEKLLTEKKPSSDSRTLMYLRGEEVIPTPEKRRDAERGQLKIRGGNLHNIKNLNVDIPLGRFVAVTGVSGSGKSSFVHDIVYRNLEARLGRRTKVEKKAINAEHFTGTEYVRRVVMIDQTPIGRTPRSNPATYTGAYSHIRDLFAASAEARIRGWKPGRFSFNVRGGRCETCQGNGEIAVEMNFLPTVYVPCDVCKGKRFDKETLEVTYRDKNIFEVLSLSIEEAYIFFQDIPAIADRIGALVDVGLGYLALGQSATTLSGGESQRMKIASELYRKHIEKTVYILDEPSIGLHYDDVDKLIQILNQLVVRGHTVMVIEHNLDIVKSSDYVIDMGPEGGKGGGKLVAFGTPEELARNKASHTGTYLAKLFKKELSNAKKRS